MIYTRLTVKAMQTAYAAHHGQLDKSGVPYIFHPYHVAEQLDSEAAVCAALLHDVVEDTDITLDELSRDFPPEIVEAIRLLTHDDSEDYEEYLRKIKENPIARAVKLQDIAHNSDQSRFVSEGCVSPEKLERLRKKYSAARRILGDE